MGFGLTVLVTCVAILAGCGGGELSKADTAAVGKTALKDSQMKLSSSIELCVGKSLVDDLGLETARTAVKQADLSKMPTAQRKAAIKSFDECVPSSAFVATFVAQLPSGGSSTELEACLTKEFDGKVGTWLPRSASRRPTRPRPSCSTTAPPTTSPCRPSSPA